MTSRHQASRTNPSWEFGVCPLAGEFITTPPDNPAAGNAALTQSLLEYVPMVSGWSIPIDRWCIFVNTIGGTGTVIRVGLYRPDVRNRPGALIQDLGTVSGTTAGSVTSAAITATLPPGLFYVGVVMQGAAAACKIESNYSHHLMASFCPRPSAFVDSAGGTSGKFTQASVTGALPASATPVVTGASTVLPTVPMVGFRAA